MLGSPGTVKSTTQAERTHKSAAKTRIRVGCHGLRQRRRHARRNSLAEAAPVLYARAPVNCLLVALLLTAPTDYEARMLADASDGQLGQLPFETAAMIAAGPKHPASIASAMLVLKRKLRPIVEAARAVDPSERPRALLTLLHGSLLKRFSKDATTLYDIVATGRYNALSASLLYTIAAERVQVEAQVVMRGDRVLVVSDHTVDPTDPKAVLEGAEDSAIEPLTLLALIYAHKATLTEDPSFLLKKAAVLDRQSLAPSYAVRVLLEGHHSYRARSIADADALVLAIVDRQTPAPSEVEAWGARLEPFTNIRYEALAKLYLKANDLSGAAFAIELGRKTCGDDCAALVQLDLERLSKWSESDGIGAAEAFLARYPQEDAPASIANNHVLSLLSDSRCSEAQGAADRWHTDHTDNIESCFVAKGEALMRAKQFEVAAAELRTAVSAGPQVQKTLLGALTQQAMELIKQKRCREAKTWLEEGRRLDPQDAFFSEGLKYCARR